MFPGASKQKYHLSLHAVHNIWFKSNCGYAPKVPKTIISFLIHSSISDKVWQNRSIWEEMGFVELPNLDTSVGAQVQENVATAIQEIFSLTSNRCFSNLKKRRNLCDPSHQSSVVSHHSSFISQHQSMTICLSLPKRAKMRIMLIIVSQLARGEKCGKMQILESSQACEEEGG